MSLKVEPGQIGFQGQVRGGAWTPMRVTLENRSSSSRVVRCQWTLPDCDGDTVIAQRKVTLSPRRTQWAWLYGPVTLTAEASKEPWVVRVIDDQSNELLASVKVRAPGVLGTVTSVVGVIGSGGLGLGPYESPATQHATIRVVRDLDPRRLPDRWYGFSMLESLIWTPEATGGDDATGGSGPLDPRISLQTFAAIREWVWRGGHLVVVLPSVGSTWGASEMGDLYPRGTTRRLTDQAAPYWLGRFKGETGPRIDLNVFDSEVAGGDGQGGGEGSSVMVGGGGGESVILRDRVGQAVVVARRYGFGRVTWVGVDLTDRVVAGAGLPNGPDLWRAVFGWQSPAYPRGFVEEKIRENLMAHHDRREHVALDLFLPSAVAMHETATTAVLAAMVLFGVYWLAAGPMGFAYLKRRGWTRHSWVVFLGVVGVFTAVSWSGAAMMRSRQTVVRHFTVLDADVGSGAQHVRSWLSLYVPTRGARVVALPAGSIGEMNIKDTAGATGVSGVAARSGGDGTLASMGNDLYAGVSGFADPQSYVLDGAGPDEVKVPIRATTKQFTLDWACGSTPSDRASAVWSGPRGRIDLRDGWPTGVLTHELPVGLSNVLLVYCPGGRRVPWVRRAVGRWEPGQPLGVRFTDEREALVRPYGYDKEGNRLWKQEGFLGRLIAMKTGQAWADMDEAAVRAVFAGNEVVQAIELLTFYSALPPPDYRNTRLMERSVNYDRPLGHGLDLTALTGTRCMILIGHAEDSALPVGLMVDGKAVGGLGGGGEDSVNQNNETEKGNSGGGGTSGGGWTVVRWVFPLEEDGGDSASGG